jgi:type II secretory pathway pseudopilin PulG
MMATRLPQGDAMPRMISTLALTFVLALFSAIAPAAAEPVSAADTKAVRAVEAQLAAFAADDAKRAFSYAAPSIREMFGTPERFVAMVRAGYPVVYRPSNVNFLLPVWVDGQLVQGVHLTDADGALWLALYRLERQADKSWRISGCEVQPASGKST